VHRRSGASRAGSDEHEESALKGFHLLRNDYASLYLPVLVFWAAVAVPLHAAGVIVLLIGPPGSGRTTQAEFLRKDLGMPVIAVDDLIARNQHKFQKYKTPALNGIDPRLDPALNDLVEEALRTADLSNGVVLDGYPASKIQGDSLTAIRQKLDLSRAVVIHLSAPDDVVRKRLKGQSRDVEQELKDYHREFDFVRQYFPTADIRTLDATKEPAEVARQIRKVLQSGQH
jgi:adenylate kinase family enzyme